MKNFKSGFSITEIIICILLVSAVTIVCCNTGNPQKRKHLANATEVITKRGTTAKQPPVTHKQASDDTKPAVKIITRAGQCDTAVKRFDKLGGLRETYYPDVYCTILGTGSGKYEKQEHYVCNKRTGKLVKLPDVYYVTSSGTTRDGKMIDVEEMQVSVQRYHYTNIAGVYEKSGQLYKYSQNGKFTPYR